MPITPFKSVVLVVGAVLAAAPCALAVQPPSIIEHTALKDPWTVGIIYSMVNPGKVKIFDQEPQYTDSGELTDDSVAVAELRNSKQTFKLDRMVRTYWIIFYPEKGLTNLTLKFHKQGTQDASDAKLQVKRVDVKNVGSTPEILKATNASKAKFNVKNFEYAKGGSLVVLN